MVLLNNNYIWEWIIRYRCYWSIPWWLLMFHDCVLFVLLDHINWCDHIWGLFGSILVFFMFLDNIIANFFGIEAFFGTLMSIWSIVLMTTYVCMFMIDTNFMYHKFLIGLVRLVGDSIMYARLHVYKTMSIDIIYMFSIIYFLLWMSYTLFGENW